jgi:hypothetical protein
MGVNPELVLAIPLGQTFEVPGARVTFLGNSNGYNIPDLIASFILSVACYVERCEPSQALHTTAAIKHTPAKLDLNQTNEWLLTAVMIVCM